MIAINPKRKFGQRNLAGFFSAKVAALNQMVMLPFRDKLVVAKFPVMLTPYRRS